jgi:hypothetical protein
VVTPFVAFWKSPTDLSHLGVGVLKGALSLLSHSTSGFFGFIAKVSATAGQGVATLSLDSDFRIWHRDKIVTEVTNLNREWKRRGLQSMQAMVTRPVYDIFFGVGTAITGVIMSPIRGYEREGRIGLVKGVAIGGLGIISKPTVGVLDALAHFTASIHDIAKSVNVLEKRYQPAIKYRLPYTFGIMNILEPYDYVLARAAFLLNIFPSKKQRKATTSSEVLIHAEFLPNIGTDTYAIITSSRILLIKIKKELMGELIPTLSWEVFLFAEAKIASKLSDHGHNGVALSITMTKMFENKDSGLGLEASVHEGTYYDTQETTNVQHTPLATEAGNPRSSEFRHGLSRGNRGELIEWYTILAEYQFRRQLARLHNVICCLVGNFNDLITDSLLGRPGSTEGYTSFGIFFFEHPSEVSRKSRSAEDPLGSVLEFVPWVSEKTFADIAEHEFPNPPNYLSNLRRQWTYADEINASRIEGGQEWIIAGRADAVFLVEHLETPKNSKLSDINTDAESTSREASDKIPPVLSKGDDDSTKLDASGSAHNMFELAAAPIAGFFFTPSDTIPSSTSKSIDSTLERSYSPGEQNTPKSALSTNANQSPQRTESVGEAHHYSYVDEELSNDALVKNVNSPDSAGHAKSTKATRSQSPDALQATYGYRPSKRKSNDTRIERMEALIEKLLVLNTEQVLHGHHDPRNCFATTDVSEASAETEEIRLELQRMREQLQKHMKNEEESHKEIDAMRNEIAQLRTQIGSSIIHDSSRSDGSITTHSQQSFAYDDIVP